MLKLQSIRVGRHLLGEYFTVQRRWLEAGRARRAGSVDPDSGGVHATVLFLLENPGPQASAERGSGFISIDNNDGSAENFFRLHVEAELPRHRFVNWNVVPWYQAASATSTANATRTDVEDARPWLDRLIHLLPDLRLVITIGAAARDGWMGCWLPTPRSHYRRRSPSRTVPPRNLMIAAVPALPGRD